MKELQQLERQLESALSQARQRKVLSLISFVHGFLMIEVVDYNVGLNKSNLVFNNVLSSHNDTCCAGSSSKHMN